VVLFIALLISYPWYILSACSIAYLLSLPAGWKSYRDHERKAATQAAASNAVPVPASEPSSPSFTPAPTEPNADDRPTRLN
jgi:CDP-diacylglycerol---serine O-phosphatidyltransferase